MIQFTRLRISEDRKFLLLSIKVREESYYNNIFLTGITIQDKNTYSSDNTVWASYFEPNPVKEIDVEIPLSNILANISNNILFISVDILGSPSIDCPCGQDVIPTAVFADLCGIVDKVYTYAKELSNNCEIPNGFINYLLLYKAFEYSIKTCHYKEAIGYFNKLINNSNQPVNSDCSCYG